MSLAVTVSMLPFFTGFVLAGAVGDDAFSALLSELFRQML
ncbi:hypothetical protein SAMN05216278_3420 [Halopelagius longus]|uniref:Uncharacterized protein n=1 Tax=Halopelagius longus TaxID=1236180 RepID=A0A1H1FZH2_9EURY|nr:hypothetical protein SAMN05216278_3420 [Halopelagius longus]